ncbi:hypothetical protein ACFCZ1_13260 [Streptomyces sp. NPDC056224]|uniref:hypothetical protein n=1 Tax=Streptomyces sp. NPDC056224 TaxID=3345750 RepID=UPI0035E0588F
MDRGLPVRAPPHSATACRGGPPPLALGAGAAAVAGAGPAVRRGTALWVACGLSAAAGSGLLTDVVGLLCDQGADGSPAAVPHALGLLGAVLLAGATTPPYGRARGGAAAFRGLPPGAPRRVSLAARASPRAWERRPSFRTRR